MRVNFTKPYKWSDGHNILRFDAGPATVPDKCGALAIELGLAELGKVPKPKPKKEEKLDD